MSAPYPPQNQPAAAAPPKVYSAERRHGWEHIPVYPNHFIVLRIVQLVLAVIVLALCAFTVHFLPTSGASLSLFVALATMITTVWLLVAHYSMPKIYNYWAVLGLDIFLVVFWLIAMAVTASEANLFFTNANINSSYYGNPEGLLLAWLACMATAAALGGVLFALFVVSLTFHAIALHRHRAAGLHCTPGAARTTPGGGPAPDAEKNTAHAAFNPAYQAAPMMQQQQQPYVAPVQQGGYPQQQQPQQQPQQYYNAAQVSGQHPQEMYYAPDAQYSQPQFQPQQQQQQVYPPQQAASPAPLSAQYTGNSTQVSGHNEGAAPAPAPNNIQEAPVQNYHQQQ